MFQSDPILAKNPGNLIVYSTPFHLLIRYVLFIFTQRDIDDAVSVWNTHRIRPTRNGGPSGKPCILYCLPELEGTKDYSTQVDPDILGICRNRSLFNQNHPGDTDMLHLFKLLKEGTELSCPGNAEEAWDLYETLRHLANYEIHIIWRKHNNLWPVTFEWSPFSVIKLMRLTLSEIVKRNAQNCTWQKKSYFGVVFLLNQFFGKNQTCPRMSKHR